MLGAGPFAGGRNPADPLAWPQRRARRISGCRDAWRGAMSVLYGAFVTKRFRLPTNGCANGGACPYCALVSMMFPESHGLASRETGGGETSGELLNERRRGKGRPVGGPESLRQTDRGRGMACGALPPPFACAARGFPYPPTFSRGFSAGIRFQGGLAWTRCCTLYRPSTRICETMC